MHSFAAWTSAAGCGSPTLEEVLDALPRRAWIDVELKKETLRTRDCAPISEILDARVPRRRLMISTFGPRLLQPDYLNLPMISLLGRHKVRFLLNLLRALGFSILFWTVNDEKGARAMSGAAGIIVSDEVEMMVRLRDGAPSARRLRAEGARERLRGGPA